MPHTFSMLPVFIFSVGFFCGAAVEYFLALFLDILEKKPLRFPKRFTLGKKICLFTLPIWGLIALLFMKNTHSYVLVFLYSSIIGTFFEGLTGTAIHKALGIKLWVYKHGGIGEFTSLYSMPYWGIAGILFAFIGKIIGI